MKKILFSIMLFTIGTAGFCTKWTITNSGYTFSPSTITINYGDSVHFSIASMHSAIEVSQATWNANSTTPLPGFSVPFGGGMVYPSQLTVGTHYYVCGAHASLGMKGIIIVQSLSNINVYTAKTDFSVYPNPSKGKFHLEISSIQPAKSYDVKIFDLAGNWVYVKYGLEQHTPDIIDLSGFPKGIYFIRLNDGTEITDKKIIIQ